MKLTDEQLQQFNRDGWLLIPDAFSAEEVEAMRQASVDIYKTDRKEVWREKSGAPRTAFAAHKYNDVFAALGRDPRLIEAGMQIFGEDVYMHQFKVNAKAAFTGDVWQWHQDFPTWHKDDGMPEPRAMNISVFLDDVLPINGPLMFINGSHVHGQLDCAHDTTTTAYPLWTLDEETVTRLAGESGIVAPTGKAGALLLHHGNLVHGSSGNITPYPRKIVYLTLNAVSNAITQPTRPEFIAHQDFSPIVAGGADDLLQAARSHLKAA